MRTRSRFDIQSGLRIVTTALIVSAAALVRAADAPSAPVALPQKHDYQRVLRQHMATLTAKDFEHGVTTPPTSQPAGADTDEQYRNFILTLSPQPLVGSKRGEPAITTPAENYTLAKIETPEGVRRPYGFTEANASLIQWKYPGNPYFNNRGLKLRTFVLSVIQMTMIDEHMDRNPLLVRTDRIPYYLVRVGAPWPVFKDELPAPVQQAYRDGVRRLAERVLALTPKGEEPNLDMMTPVGLSYAARVLDDPAFSKRVEDYARVMFTDPQYLHPAGYWIERGGLDINYSGTTNYFATWAALMNDWPFAIEAIDKVYRLRAHLMLPEPNGLFTGPSAFNNRTGGATIGDQWEYKNRDRAAAMITDEAAYLTPLPTSEQLLSGGGGRAIEYGRQIAENPGYLPNDKLVNTPWAYSILANYNFPASVNPAYEFYKKGSLAHLQQLAARKPALMKSPYLRGEMFVRDFGGAFTAVRRPTYAAIVHAGPVGEQRPDDGRFQFSAPLGYGGGQLAAFWTPGSGSTILARRSGQAWDKPFEDRAGWRNLPIHAATGVTVDGTLFTSARIVKPKVSGQHNDKGARCEVSGEMAVRSYVKDPDATDPAKTRDLCYDGGRLAGNLNYLRTIECSDTGISVKTTLTGDGKDQIAELYETLPILIKDPATMDSLAQGADDPKTTIEFQSGDRWSPATPAYAESVKAVRITRHGAAVLVTFDKPRRVKLSPADFTDVYVSRAISRAVLIDLMENGDKPGAVKGEKSVAYRIEAGK